MTIEVVLFDLGGVLIELGGVAEMGEFADVTDDDEIWSRWLSCPWVRRFERGQCDADAFADGMVETWSMKVAPEKFLQAFTAWPRGLFPGATDLIEEIDPSRRVACFSNTNAIHAERNAREFGIDDLFETRFFSHEMGMLKPDRVAFDFVVDRLGCASEAILFLDDNEINVTGARVAGLRSERVRGVAETRAILRENGLLRP